MRKAVYGVFGTGGCARGIMPLAREQLRAQSIEPDAVLFIDDNAGASPTVNGHSVLSFEQFCALEAEDHYVAIAIANSRVREQIYERIIAAGIKPLSIRAQQTVIMDDVQIGAGALLSPFVTLTSNITIGIQFHANLYSYVEHDCRIGDFVTFAPGVKCNGNIVIDDHAYIGSGAVIRQGTAERPMVIGRGAIVGMGAVVTRDVAPGTTVVGNPARPLVQEA
ncbi:MAG: acetyltransferase [Pseudomonadota bacterium]